MPKLRRLGNMAQFFLQSHLADQKLHEENDLITQRQTDLARLNDQLREAGANDMRDQNTLDKMLGDPSGRIAEGLLKSGRSRIGGYDPSNFIQTNNTAPGMADLAKAKAQADVPDPSVMLGQMIGPGKKLTNLNPVSQLLGVKDPATGDGVVGARQQTLDKISNDQQGEMDRKNAESFGSAYNSNMGTEQANAQNAPAQTARKITDTNLVESGTRKERTATAGSIAGAQAGAAAAFQKPDILYGQNGDATAIKFNPNGSVKQIALPPGLSKTGPKDLAVSEVDQLSGIGTAEVEGVKILQQLHKSGLDKSNNPTDPRWEKFVVGTLKMAPTDWNKADIQQRTAFVQAALTRSLMGARPSQYVAQMIQQHMPQGEMTGAQLNHVLNNVLQQGTERRKELANYSGKTIPEPTSGTNYSQWQQFEQQNPNQELPPGVSDILSRPARTK